MASPRQLAPPKVLDTSGLSANANMDIDEDDEPLAGHRPLGSTTPVAPASRTMPAADFAPAVLALAREVLRRAEYQRTPPSDSKVNKPLRFEGMTEEQAKLCSPEEMVDRFVDLLGGRQGREAAERLRSALEYARRLPAADKPKSVTPRQAAQKAPATPRRQDAALTGPESSPPPAAAPLPMPGPAANGVVPTPESRLRSASLNAAQRESKVMRDPTVRVDRLGPKPQALLGKPIPVGGRAATASSPAPRAPEHAAAQVARRVASAGPGEKSKQSQSTPAHSKQVQPSEGHAGDCEIVVGASGSRIVRVTSRP
jgi:hypothetical protein